MARSCPHVDHDLKCNPPTDTHLWVIMDLEILSLTWHPGDDPHRINPPQLTTTFLAQVIVAP